METITLTRENAHRVTMVRRKDTPGSEPVAFHFRGKEYGYCSYAHLVGDPADGRILPPHEFGQWEVVETAHPGYLETLWETARQAYYWNSQHPDERGETALADYEKELHGDLVSMPEGEREQYLANYKSRLSAVWASESRIANAFVTGRSNFNDRRNEKANRAYDSRYNDFRQWRERALKAVERRKEEMKSPEEKTGEEWNVVEERMKRTLATIVGIDTGVERGYNRSLFVSNLFGRIATHANNGNVEIVDRAVALVRQWNGKVRKPVITERHKFFKLPEVARNVRKQREERVNSGNRETAFDGGRVVWNYGEDRLQILFDKVPDAGMRTALKRNAFKWSPRNQAWQRQLTRNAEYAAGQVLKITI